MLRARAAASRGVGRAVATGAGVPCAPPSLERVLASPIPRPAVAGSCIASSRRSAPLFLAFEDPTPAGVDLVYAAGCPRTGRKIALPPPPMRPASSPGVSKMPLRRYTRAASGPGEARLATIPAFGQGDATLPGAFRPCRSSRLRRFAPLRAPQALRCRGPGQLALIRSRAALLLQPTLGFMPFRRLPPCHRCPLHPLDRLSALEPRGSEGQRAASSGASPVMPYPSKRFPRQQPSRRHRRAFPSRRCRSLRLVGGAAANCAFRPRWRLPASRPCSAAEVRKRGRCRQRPRPDAPMGLYPGEGGWKMLPRTPSGRAARWTAIGVGARVEPVCTRSIDRDPTSMMERPVPA